MAAAREKTTVLFSTHILSDVERICDEAAVLHDGRIVLQGTLSQMKKMRRTAVELEMEEMQDAALLLAEFPFLQAQGRNGLILKEADRLPELLSFMGERKLSVLRIEHQESALEDLFLEVMGE